jgi:diacylglycerol O-acyltransferase / wax synthase
VLARVTRHPFGTGAEVVETARSIARTVRPLPTTLSPVMIERGPGRVLHTITVGLDELKQAGASTGGTLNDSFMAAVTGGLHRYHERHGATAPELTVTVPISIRKPGDPPGGNRITLQRLRVPMDMTDPVDRMHAIGARCRAARAERSLAFTDAIASVMNLVPTGYVGSVLKHVDFLASDVTGFADEIFLCGARVTGYAAFGPTIGAALNATLFSYNGSCCIGLTVDTTAVPDHDLLVECLEEGFAEVIRSPRPGRRAATRRASGGGAVHSVPKTRASS